MIVKA